MAEARSLQCVVLAGGIATRMRPLTEKIPKALLQIDEHPFVHHQLLLLARNGVTDVVFCIGYLGEMIREYVGDGSRYGLKVSYVDEGKDLRGTAGALRLALDQGFLAESFLILYGDSYLPIQFGPVWERFLRGPEPALLTVLENLNRWDKSNSCYSGGKVTLYDKAIEPKPADMRYIDYGLSAIRRETIESRVPQGVKMDLAQVFGPLSREGNLAGFQVTERFYEIGSHSGLEDFRQLIAGADR